MKATLTKTFSSGRTKVIITNMERNQVNEAIRNGYVDLGSGLAVLEPSGPWTISVDNHQDVWYDESIWTKLLKKIRGKNARTN